MPTLTLHPHSHCDAVDRIEVDVARARGGRLRLLYSLSGRIGDVRFPQPRPAERADNLWQHTCLEAFLKPSSAPAYCEFNFAPSLQWACYRFDRYREGMAAPEGLAAPLMKSVSNGETSWALDVILALDALNLPEEATWRLGASAVIEETSGNKSYWALTHPQGKPDFHDAGGFVLELPPE
jgi:hypothetical protein